MRRVRCHECGKTYDFDTDDFCPRCGAFTQPAKSTAIDASGAVIRVEGINEKNHAGSFVHEELHEENRERKRMGLSKSTRRTVTRTQTAAVPRSSSGQSAKPVNPAKIIGWIIGAVVLMNLLSGIARLFFYW